MITKFPKLQHFILHGLNLCFHTIYYLCRNLPATMKGIDMAPNYRFGDDDIRQLMERCPNLEFLDAWETGVTMEIILELARKWGHC